ITWLGTVLGTQYQYSRGQWVDSSATNDLWIASVHAMGGPGPDVEDRRQRFRVILLGPRNGRQHAAAIQGHMETLVQAAMAVDPIPCGAASIRAINEPVGPGFTAENRAWCSVELQVTF